MDWLFGDARWHMDGNACKSKLRCAYTYRLFSRRVCRLWTTLRDPYCRLIMLVGSSESPAAAWFKTRLAQSKQLG
jgi:hypothetical protein